MKQSKGTSSRRPRLVGMNHVALEVGDIEQALAFYGRIFEFSLRSKSRNQAFIDLGDQFIALMRTAEGHKDKNRHFAVVVDDREGLPALVEDAGGTMVRGPFLDFLDPWGNRVEVVDYANVQFTKAPHVLHGMGLKLEKTKKALGELAAKGMAPELTKK